MHPVDRQHVLTHAASLWPRSVGRWTETQQDAFMDGLRMDIARDQATAALGNLSRTDPKPPTMAGMLRVLRELVPFSNRHAAPEREPEPPAPDWNEYVVGVSNGTLRARPLDYCVGYAVRQLGKNGVIPTNAECQAALAEAGSWT